MNEFAVTTELPSPPGSEDERPRPDDHVIVLHGATGDLARRKLLPGFFQLHRAGLMPENYRIVGTAGASLGDDGFRAHTRTALDEFSRVPIEEATWEDFAATLTYASRKEPGALTDAFEAAEHDLGGEPRRMHYLSVPPKAMGEIVEGLIETGLSARARLVMEKPFGTDLASAKALNASLHRCFDESEIFRIDHFLGKEAVQNVLALRFANGFYEPLWNRNNIDHVQIDIPEKLSIGSRAGFYDSTGAYRDMVVTHLMQILSFIAMEPPVSLEAKALLDEKVKVFNSMRPIDPRNVVRGQYEGYRDEDGVDPDSGTETFVALRCEIENWRWAGVPFFLRTGKRLAESRRTVTLAFREPPQLMFPHHEEGGRNHLTFELTEPGVISTDFAAKVPGAQMRLGPARMTFRYEESFLSEHQLEAYERLILEAMYGDRALFTRSDGIERLWELSAPLLEDPPPVEPYVPGSLGPEAADRLIAPRSWRTSD
ncbi:MAG: glucose-6-phosphate dehydrogenase [Solirubrobacterales bacterium]